MTRKKTTVSLIRPSDFKLLAIALTPSPLFTEKAFCDLSAGFTGEVPLINQASIPPKIKIRKTIIK